MASRIPPGDSLPHRVPHHEHRAVGVMDDGARDAAHYGALDGTHSPATNDHHPGPEFLCDAYDLRIRSSHPGVNPGDLYAHRPYLLRFVFELLADVHLRALANVSPARAPRPWARATRGGRVWAPHRLRAAPNRASLTVSPPSLRRFRPPRTLRGQQYPVSYHAHAFLLLALRFTFRSRTTRSASRLGSPPRSPFSRPRRPCTHT